MIFIMKPKTIFFLSINIFLAFLLNSQNLEQTINYADKQYDLMNYKIALKEYQRAIFFNRSIKNSYLYNQIAKCFFYNKQYIRASKYYQYAYNISDNDSIKDELIFKRTICYLLSQKYNLAKIELFSLNDTISNYFLQKRNFFLAVTYFGLESFKLSEHYFINSINKNNVDEINEIKKIFSKRKNLYRPNPKLAFYMSVIIPGSGQLYIGEIKDGINSLLLTGGLFTLGIHMSLKYTVLDAFLAIYPWFQRYHQGGSFNAKKYAIIKLQKNRSKTYKKILNIVSKSKK